MMRFAVIAAALVATGWAQDQSADGRCLIRGYTVLNGNRVVFNDCSSCMCMSGQSQCVPVCVGTSQLPAGACRLNTQTVINSGQSVLLDNGCTVCDCKNGVAMCGPTGTCSTVPITTTTSGGGCVVGGLSLPHGGRIVYNECLSCSCTNGKDTCTGNCVPQATPPSGKCRYDANIVLDNGSVAVTDNGCSLCACGNGVTVCKPSGTCNPGTVTPVVSQGVCSTVSGYSLSLGDSLIFSDCRSCTCTIAGTAPTCKTTCLPNASPANNACRVTKTLVVNDGASFTMPGCRQCRCSLGIALCKPATC